MRTYLAAVVIGVAAIPASHVFADDDPIQRVWVATLGTFTAETSWNPPGPPEGADLHFVSAGGLIGGVSGSVHGITHAAGSSWVIYHWGDGLTIGPGGITSHAVTGPQFFVPVELTPDAGLFGDEIKFGNSLTANGLVPGNANLIFEGANATLQGSGLVIDGNVSLLNNANILETDYTINGNIDVASNATIGGTNYTIGGNIDVASNATIGGTNYTIGGNVNLTPDVTVGPNRGNLRGSGLIFGHVALGGGHLPAFPDGHTTFLSPGDDDAIGAISLGPGSNLTLGSGGVHDFNDGQGPRYNGGTLTTIEIASPADFDQILGDGGQVHYGGTLRVELLDDFMPQIGDSFAVFDGFSAASGTFGRFEFPELPEYVEFLFDHDTGVLSTVSRYPGDVDGNGTVNRLDVLRLLRGYGTTSAATWEDGDMSDSGSVGLDDLGILQANLGGEIGSQELATAAVPEPSALLMAGVAFFFLWFVRKRKFYFQTTAAKRPQKS